jgi:N-acetylglucosamine-6-sulfatase
MTTAQKSRPTVLFVGDSITHGTDWGAYIDFASVENIAVPGFTTDDVKAQIDLITKSAPDLISLKIGTNDFGNTALDRTGEDVGARVTAIIEEIHSYLPKTKLIINSIAPRGRDFTDRIHTANNIIQGACKSPIEYLDLWPALSVDNWLNPDYLLPDGFDGHLSDAGYAAWREVLFPRIKTALNIN